MNELLSEINSQSGWDWVLKSYDGWNLCFSSGSSAQYATPLVAFSGVSYLDCPTEFSHPNFRLSTASERERIGGLVPLDEDDFVVAIEAETMARIERNVFFLVVQSGELMPKAQPSIPADA